MLHDIGVLIRELPIQIILGHHQRLHASDATVHLVETLVHVRRKILNGFREFHISLLKAIKTPLESVKPALQPIKTTLESIKATFQPVETTF